MLLQSYLTQANIHSATRVPIPSELLNKWQKHVGKKGAKSTLYKSWSPSPINDSDSDFPPLGPITPLITYTTWSSLPGGDANAVAGPSTLHQSQSNSMPETSSNRHHDSTEVIEIEGAYFLCCSGELLKILIPDSESAPSPRQERTASPTINMIENINTSFSGSFYVDESLKALNPWDAINEAWEF